VTPGRTAALALAALLGLGPSACKTDGISCKYTGRSGEGIWSQCSDGISRRLHCEHTSCRCSENGAVGRVFPATGFEWEQAEAATMYANEQCGWKLAE
jgi:hypothetical protein